MTTTLPLSKFRANASKMLNLADRGEPVRIMRGARFYRITREDPLEPIPLRPAGYFAVEPANDAGAGLINKGDANFVPLPQ
ncbi:MAG: hypothetical protein LBM92_08850 [Opitutaceae bacterium]|nr:hypothetical protein [Opitutaceae bacterium]